MFSGIQLGYLSDGLLESLTSVCALVDAGVGPLVGGGVLPIVDAGAGVRICDPRTEDPAPGLSLIHI